MIRSRLAACVLAGWFAAVAAPAADNSPWLARAFIPSSNNVHGEVRLLQRGDAACFQTLLYSRHLRRGLHEMARQERLSWPEGYPCHADSTNYLAALAQGRDRVMGAAEDQDTNRLYRLLIECTLGPAQAACAVYEIELTGPPDELRVERPRLVVERPVHPFYASRAMKLMGERGFAMSGEDLERLLGQAGWRAADGPELPEAQQVVPR